MKKKYYILSSPLVALFLIYSHFAGSEDNAYQPISDTIENYLSLEELKEVKNNYKTWYQITKGNPNTGDPTRFLSGKHRGNKAYREVYINKIGEAVNKGSAPYKYPAGTMVVKEEYKNKADWESGGKPRLKLMVKLKPGTSPETGDWGYSNNPNSKTVSIGTSSNAKFCTSCHVIAAEQGDYIFMNSDLLKREALNK